MALIPSLLSFRLKSLAYKLIVAIKYYFNSQAGYTISTGYVNRKNNIVSAMLTETLAGDSVNVSNSLRCLIVVFFIWRLKWPRGHCLPFFCAPHGGIAF